MIRYVRNKDGEITVDKKWSSNCGTAFIHKSVTDLSHWSPDLEATKHLQLALQGSSNTLLYDYADGVDNGSSLYLLRRKDLDVTERDALLETVFDRNLEQAQTEADDAVDKIKDQIDKSKINKSSDSSSDQSTGSE